MNLKNYALSVSLAAIIGLLLVVAPLVRSALEYRSPELVEPRPELASLDVFILARDPHRSTEDVVTARRYAQLYVVNFWDRNEWQAMYLAEKSQHVESVKHKALVGVIAYGSVCGLCIVLLITHLIWSRRTA
jgi:hypothetical protein